MEIGSEFVLDNRVSMSEGTVFNELMKFPNTVLTSSGRGAISLVLKHIKPEFKRVLLPIYICDSVISVFESNNYEIDYYDLNKDFSPNLKKIKNIGVFFHMGYFGFNTNQSIEKEISIMKESSIIIIEDLTHSMFTKKQSDMNSDYYVGSIRKWFGIPSGGFVAGIEKLLVDSEKQEDFVNLRLKNFLLKQEYLKNKGDSLKNKFLSGFSEAEGLLDKDNNSYSLDEISKNIIKNTLLQDITDARRNNFLYLLKNIKCSKNISVIFNDLPKSVTPLFFLIAVKGNRNELRTYLANNSIYCPIHWPIANQIETELKDYKMQKIYNEILSIPCDQRYNLKDMERIVRVLSSFGG